LILLTLLALLLHVRRQQNSLPKQVLGQPPSLKFDLKGSSFGRYASKSELAKKSKATLKDIDFERVFPLTSGGLRIRPADYEKLAHRINQDARVLAELEIMDHSLVRATLQNPQTSNLSTPSLSCPLCPALPCPALLLALLHATCNGFTLAARQQRLTLAFVLFPVLCGVRAAARLLRDTATLH
jgi:hypothetical protein